MFYCRGCFCLKKLFNGNTIRLTKYFLTGLQGRNRDTDVENKRMDTKGGKWGWGGGVMNWEIGIDMYTLIYVKQITNKNLLYKKIIKFKNSKKLPHNEITLLSY